MCGGWFFQSGFVCVSKKVLSLSFDVFYAKIKIIGVSVITRLRRDEL